MTWDSLSDVAVRPDPADPPVRAVDRPGPLSVGPGPVPLTRPDLGLTHTSVPPASNGSVPLSPFRAQRAGGQDGAVNRVTVSAAEPRWVRSGPARSALECPRHVQRRVVGRPRP